MEQFQNTLIQVVNEGMGQGSAELSVKLITNYFKLLYDDEKMPKIIVFYNSGVKLLTENNPCIPYLDRLQKSGVLLMACKTCMNFYGIEKMAVGKAGTMHDIIELQAHADKVITL